MLKSSPDALIAASSQYVKLCESGQVKRPDFWHFCGWIGEVADDVSGFIKSNGSTGCGYPDGCNNPDEVKQDVTKNRVAADALRRLCTFIRGQYSTAPAWSGAQTNKAIFAQKQDFDGAAMQDRKSVDAGGEIKLQIVGGFGDIADAFD